jgi:hypothetical protein
VRDGIAPVSVAFEIVALSVSTLNISSHYAQEQIAVL